MPDYQLGKIYRITSSQTENVYIGSTAQTLLCRRMGEHVSDYKRFINGKLKSNKGSFEIIKHGDAIITLIETFPCNSKDELHAREQHFIDLNTELIVNKQKAYTGIESGLKGSEYYKAYHLDNKLEIYAKKNARKNCKCGKDYNHSNYARHSKSKYHQAFLNAQPPTTE